MKFNFLLLILFLFSSSLFAQNFSGEIEYEISFIAKNNEVNLDSISSAYPGSKAIYLIKDGFYKNSYFKNDEFSYSFTYENITKRMYDQRVENEYLTFRDSRKANMKPSNSTIYKDSTSYILGKKCFLVVYEEENSISKTYYSNRIKVNASSFKNHEVGNWYKKIKEVNGSIGLKTVTEYNDYIIVLEAVNINKRDVKRNEFALPDNKFIIASFSSLDKNVEMVSPNQDQLDCYFDKIKAAIESKPVSKPLTSVISFIITKDGDIKNLKPVEEDEYGFYKVAIEIIENCGITFNPGEINNGAVSSLTYFPITFE